MEDFIKSGRILMESASAAEIAIGGVSAEQRVPEADRPSEEKGTSVQGGAS